MGNETLMRKSIGRAKLSLMALLVAAALSLCCVPAAFASEDGGVSGETQAAHADSAAKQSGVDDEGASEPSAGDDEESADVTVMGRVYPLLLEDGSWSTGGLTSDGFDGSWALAPGQEFELRDESGDPLACIEAGTVFYVVYVGADVPVAETVLVFEQVSQDSGTGADGDSEPADADEASASEVQEPETAIEATAGAAGSSASTTAESACTSDVASESENSTTKSEKKSGPKSSNNSSSSSSKSSSKKSSHHGSSAKSSSGHASHHASKSGSSSHSRSSRASTGQGGTHYHSRSGKGTGAPNSGEETENSTESLEKEASGSGKPGASKGKPSGEGSGHARSGKGGASSGDAGDEAQEARDGSKADPLWQLSLISSTFAALGAGGVISFRRRIG